MIVMFTPKSFEELQGQAVLNVKRITHYDTEKDRLGLFSKNKIKQSWQERLRRMFNK